MDIPIPQEMVDQATLAEIVKLKDRIRTLTNSRNSWKGKAQRAQARLDDFKSDIKAFEAVKEEIENFSRYRLGMDSAW